jgi:hypothetical protein
MSSLTPSAKVTGRPESDSATDLRDVDPEIKERHGTVLGAFSRAAPYALRGDGRDLIVCLSALESLGDRIDSRVKVTSQHHYPRIPGPSDPDADRAPCVQRLKNGCV